MANEEHLDILKQGVEAWNEWRERNPEVEPDLSGVDFTEVYLERRPESNNSIDRRSFRLCDNLMRVNFQKANLEKAIFDSANLTEAELILANVSRASFISALLNKTKLSEAKLDHCQFIGVSAKRAIFSHAYLSKSRFNGTNLAGAYFPGADLSGAHIERVSFNLEDLSYPEPHFGEAILIGACLKGLDLSGVNFFRADLSRALFEDVKFYGTNFTKAVLVETDLQEANLRNAIFKNANLTGANLFKADLRGVHGRGANFQGANLSKIILNHDLLQFIPDELQNEYGDSFQFLQVGIKYAAIHREIEFPPEYLRAGKMILSDFADILEKKYPDKKAKVSIGQIGQKVTMSIQPIEGDPEFFEKALDEYGLMVTEKISPEEYSDDKLLVVQLKSQIRGYKNEVRTQRDLLQLQRSDIKELVSMIGEGLKAKQPLVINASPTATSDSKSSSKSDLKASFSVNTQLELNSLGKALRGIGREIPEVAEEIAPIEAALDDLPSDATPEQIKETGILDKVQKLLDKAEDTNTKFGKAVEAAGKGVEIAKKIGTTLGKLSVLMGI